MSDSMAVADGLSAVQARINQLQAMLAWRSPSVSGAGASTTGTSTSASSSSADFATALQSALGTTAASDGTDPTATATDPLSALTSTGLPLSGSALSALSGLTGSATSPSLGVNLGQTIGTALGSAIVALIGHPLPGAASAAQSGTAAGSGAVSSGSSGSAAAGPLGANLGAQAVELAKQYSGVPYRWGGTNPETGVDCSGLTQSVYATLGVNLPRVAADQATSGTAVPSLAAAEPGDLVFFGSPAHHVGIYVGNGKMIDAPHTGSSVGIHPLWGTPSAIRRPTAPAAAGPATSTATVAAASVGGVADPGVKAPDSPYGALFQAAGAKYGVDPALLSAVAKAESGYNPSAVSSVGAQGLMQLMPSTAKSLGVDPYDPASAVDGAARMISGLVKSFGGNTDLAIAGYNAGPAAVRRYGGVPPYAETQTYVRRVNQYWENLR